MKGNLRFKDGAWRLRVDVGRDPLTGKRRSIYKTVHAPDNKRGRSQAESELARLVVDAEAQRALPASGLTVDQLLDRYIPDKAPSNAPDWEHETRRRVDMHITPYLGGMAIEQVKPAHVQNWHAQLRAAGVTNENTLGRVHDILNAALNWAERLELLTRNPASKVTRPRGPQRDITPPSAADVVRLIENASVEVGLFIRIGALTGGRRGQVCGLRWSDVHLPPGANTSEAGYIRWTHALGKVRGGTVLKGTKTGAKWPVALDADTIDMMRAHRKRCAERALAAGTGLEDDAYVFARDVAGKKPWHPDGASQRFAKVRDALGLGHVRLHDLRHWMATEGFGSGADPNTVAGRGGWADNTTPLAVYGHFQPPRDAALADQLARRLEDEANEDIG